MRHFIPHLQITATHGQMITTYCQVTSAHIQTSPPLLLLITTYMQTANRHKQIIPVHKKASAPLLFLINTHVGCSWQLKANYQQPVKNEPPLPHDCIVWFSYSLLVRDCIAFHFIITIKSQQ